MAYQGPSGYLPAAQQSPADPQQQQAGYGKPAGALSYPGMQNAQPGTFPPSAYYGRQYDTSGMMGPTGGPNAGGSGGMISSASGYYAQSIPPTHPSYGSSSHHQHQQIPMHHQPPQQQHGSMPPPQFGHAPNQNATARSVYPPAAVDRSAPPGGSYPPPPHQSFYNSYMGPPLPQTTTAAMNLQQQSSGSYGSQPSPSPYGHSGYGNSNPPPQPSHAYYASSQQPAQSYYGQPPQPTASQQPQPSSSLHQPWQHQQGYLNGSSALPPPSGIPSQQNFRPPTMQQQQPPPPPTYSNDLYSGYLSQSYPPPPQHMQQVRHYANGPPPPPTSTQQQQRFNYPSSNNNAGVANPQQQPMTNVPPSRGSLQPLDSASSISSASPAPPFGAVMPPQQQQQSVYGGSMPPPGSAAPSRFIMPHAHQQQQPFHPSGPPPAPSSPTQQHRMISNNNLTPFSGTTPSAAAAAAGASAQPPPSIPPPTLDLPVASPSSGSYTGQLPPLTGGKHMQPIKLPSLQSPITTASPAPPGSHHSRHQSGTFSPPPKNELHAGGGKVVPRTSPLPPLSSAGGPGSSVNGEMLPKLSSPTTANQRPSSPYRSQQQQQPQLLPPVSETLPPISRAFSNLHSQQPPPHHHQHPHPIHNSFHANSSYSQPPPSSSSAAPIDLAPPLLQPESPSSSGLKLSSWHHAAPYPPHKPLLSGGGALPPPVLLPPMHTGDMYNMPPPPPHVAVGDAGGFNGVMNDQGPPDLGFNEQQYHYQQQQSRRASRPSGGAPEMFAGNMPQLMPLTSSSLPFDSDANEPVTASTPVKKPKPPKVPGRGRGRPRKNKEPIEPTSSSPAPGAPSLYSTPSATEQLPSLDDIAAPPRKQRGRKRKQKSGDTDEADADRSGSSSFAIVRSPPFMEPPTLPDIVNSSEVPAVEPHALNLPPPFLGSGDAIPIPPDAVGGYVLAPPPPPPPLIASDNASSAAADVGYTLPSLPAVVEGDVSSRFAPSSDLLPPADISVDQMSSGDIFAEPPPKRSRRPVRKSKKAEAAEATEAAAAAVLDDADEDEVDKLYIDENAGHEAPTSGRRSKSGRKQRLSKKSAGTVDDSLSDAVENEAAARTSRGRGRSSKRAAKPREVNYDLNDDSASTSSQLLPPPPISSGGAVAEVASDSAVESDLANSSSFLSSSQASLDELVPKKKSRGRGSPRRKPAGGGVGGALTTKFLFGKRKRKRLGSDDDDEEEEVTHSSRSAQRDSSAAAVDRAGTTDGANPNSALLLHTTYAEKRRSARNTGQQRKHYDADAELDEQLEKLARLSDDETTPSSRRRQKRKEKQQTSVAVAVDADEKAIETVAEPLPSDEKPVDAIDAADAATESDDDDDAAVDGSGGGGGGARPGRMDKVIVEKILASRTRKTTLRQLTIERRELEDKKRKQEMEYFAALEANNNDDAAVKRTEIVEKAVEDVQKEKRDALVPNTDAAGSSGAVATTTTVTDTTTCIVSPDKTDSDLAKSDRKSSGGVYFATVAVRSNVTEYGSSTAVPPETSHLPLSDAVVGDGKLANEGVSAVETATSVTVVTSADTPAALVSADAGAVAVVESTTTTTATVIADNTVGSADEFDADDDMEQLITEYLVKYKGLSYLHCEWRTADELEEDDPRFPGKLKRWAQKKEREGAQFADDEDEPFNPDFVEVDRVLDERQLSDPERPNERKLTYYLVKWEALSYDDSTWEKAFNVPEQKVLQFRERNRLDPAEQQQRAKKVPRPPASKWRKLPRSEMVYKNDNVLRDYQEVGVDWLLYCWYNRQNCILADEMGLGKTVQSVTYLEQIARHRIRGPFLVVVPLSTIGNWKRELEGWTDLNGIVYHGTSTSRDIIREFEMFYRNADGAPNGKPVPGLYKFNVLITTYEILLTDIFELQEIEWRVCIIDEAHRLKNKKCKLIQGLNLLKVEHRVLLTGTPLQNNVEELYNLLNFLEPERFSSSEEFLNEFGNLHSDEQVRKLQAILKPMMLRRMKEDVEKSIAPKEETIVEVELTNIQKKYYRAILERNFSFLLKGTKSNANLPNLMNTMMELRKCCNHPFLINGAEEQVLEEFRAAQVEKRIEDPQMHMDAMVQASGKLVLVDKLLPKLREGGHKVLIFSQMVRVLDILEDYLAHRGYLYERLDGRVRGIDRQAAIDRFSRKDSDRFVFLLCTRAGGLGINLTAADTVVIYDSDWNPQNDLQAQARCHRIGQEKFVKIYRLITRNSYEREMFDKASLKLGLDKAVLQSMSGGATASINAVELPQQSAKAGQLSKADIEDLLKKGAYGALMEGDDNAADKFCEEDIDQILSRRAHVVKIESGVAGSTFSKASFSATGTETDIDINDPDFWDKWAKKADVNTEPVPANVELIVYGSRSRKQTRRYHETLQHEEDMPNEAGELAAGISPVPGGGSNDAGRNRNRKLSKFLSDEDDSASDAASLGGAVRPGSWLKSECHKMERSLLTFGWRRWEPITDEMRRSGGGNSRRAAAYTDRDAEIFCRTILHYCIKSYTSDFSTRLEILTLIHRSFVNDPTAQYPSECVQPDHLLEPPKFFPPADESSSSETAKNDSAKLGPVSGGDEPQSDSKTQNNKNQSAKANAAKKNGRKLAAEAENGENKTKRRRRGGAGKKRGGKKSRRAASISDDSDDDDDENDTENDTSSSDSSSEDVADSSDEEDGGKKKKKRNAKKQKPSKKPGDDGVALNDDEKENFSVPNKYVHPLRPKWEIDPNNDPSLLLRDESYRRHLDKYTVRILQRIRLLHFLHENVIGNENAQLILAKLSAASIPLKQPDASDVGDAPAPWWNEECDKSLIIGIYKHGYERYNDMIADRCLCFHGKMTTYAAQYPQPSIAMQPALNKTVDVTAVKTEADEKREFPAGNISLDADKVELITSSATKTSEIGTETESAIADSAPGPQKDADGPPPQPVFVTPLPVFPTNADMNTRIKRYVAAYQRLMRREEEQLIKLAAREQRLHRIAERREARKVEQAQKKWSRREENEFFRLITTYGVGYRQSTAAETDDLDYDWDVFRQRSKNLDKKLDKTLTEYFGAYNAMCRQVCGRSLTQEEEFLLATSAGQAEEGVAPYCEPVSEDKARKVVQRTDLLQRIHRALQHSELDERLALCEMTPEMPAWWMPGKHDKALLQGIAKHGFLQMNQLIFHDPELGFRELFQPDTNLVEAKQNDANMPTESDLIENSTVPDVAAEAPSSPKNNAVEMDKSLMVKYEQKNTETSVEQDQPAAAPVAAKDIDGKVTPTTTSPGASEQEQSVAAALDAVISQVTRELADLSASSVAAADDDKSVGQSSEHAVRKISSSRSETVVCNDAPTRYDAVDEMAVASVATDEEPASEAALLLERQLNSSLAAASGFNVTPPTKPAKKKRNRGPRQQQVIPHVFQHILLQCDPATDDDTVVDVKLTILNLLDSVCNELEADAAADAVSRKSDADEISASAEKVIPAYMLVNHIEATRESAVLAAAAASDRISTPVVYLWPRDKTIANRLEDVLYTIEHGQWPSAAVRMQLRRRGEQTSSSSAATAATTTANTADDVAENDDADLDDADEFERDYSEDPPSSTYSSSVQVRRRSSFVTTFTDAAERDNISPLFSNEKHRISSNATKQHRQTSSTTNASFFGGGGSISQNSSSNVISSSASNNIEPFFVTQNINSKEISFLGVPSSNTDAAAKPIKRRKTSATATNEQQPPSPHTVALQLAQSLAAFQVPTGSSSAQQQVMSNNAANALELSLLNMSNKVNELSLDEQRQLYEEFLETYVREQASLKKKMRPARRGRRSNAEIEAERVELQQEAHNAFIKQFGNLPGMALANPNKILGASSNATASSAAAGTSSQQPSSTNTAASTANDLLMMATPQQLQQLLELAAAQQLQQQQQQEQQQQQQLAARQQQQHAAAAAAESAGKRGGRRGRRPRIDAVEPIAGSGTVAATKSSTPSAANASGSSSKHLTQQQQQQQQQNEQLIAAILAAAGSAGQPGATNGASAATLQQQLLLQQQLQQIGFQEQQAVELAQLHTLLGPSWGGMLVQTAVAELTNAAAAAAAAAADTKSAANATAASSSSTSSTSAAQLQQQQQQALQLLLTFAAGGNAAGIGSDDGATQMLRLFSEQNQQQQQQQANSTEKLTFNRPGEIANATPTVIKRRKAIRDTGGSINKQQQPVLAGAAANFFASGNHVAAEQHLAPSGAGRGGGGRGQKLHRKLDNLFKTKPQKTDAVGEQPDNADEKQTPVPRKRRSRLSSTLSNAAALNSSDTQRESSVDDDAEAVPVMSTLDGTTLTGRKAPRSSSIKEFLQQNPRYIVLDKDAAAKMSVGTNDTEQPQQHRRRKRAGSSVAADAPRSFAEQTPKQQQSQQLTGNEHVVVVHRGTKQRLTGQDAPTLKQLGEWLEQHAEYDVDAEWVALIHAAAAASTTDTGNSTIAVNTALPTATAASASASAVTPKPAASRTSKNKAADAISSSSSAADAESSAAAAALLSFQQQLSAMTGVQATDKPSSAANPTSAAELMLNEAQKLAALTQHAAAAAKQTTAAPTASIISSTSTTASSTATVPQQHQDPMAAISDALMAALMAGGGAGGNFMLPGTVHQPVVSATPSGIATSTVSTTSSTPSAAALTATTSAAAQKQLQQQQQQEMDMLTQLLFGQLQQQQQQQQQQNQQAAALAALYGGSIPASVAASLMGGAAPATTTSATTATSTSSQQNAAALQQQQQQQQMMLAAQFAQLAGMPGLSASDLNMLGLAAAAGMPAVASSSASAHQQQQQQQQQQQAALLNTMMMLGGGANAGGMNAGNMDAFFAAMLSGQAMPTTQHQAAAVDSQRSASRASASSREAHALSAQQQMSGAASKEGRKQKSSAAKASARQPTNEPPAANFATPEPAASIMATAAGGGTATPSATSSSAGTPGLKAHTALKSTSTPTPQQPAASSSSSSFAFPQPTTSADTSAQLYSSLALAHQQQQAAAAAVAACGLNPFAMLGGNSAAAGLPASMLAAFGLPPSSAALFNSAAPTAAQQQQMNGAASLLPGGMTLESLQNAAALEQLFGLHPSALGMIAQKPTDFNNTDSSNGAGTSSDAKQQLIQRKRGPGRPPKTSSATTSNSKHQ